MTLDSLPSVDLQSGTETEPPETEPPEIETAAPVPVNKADTTAAADPGDTVYTHAPRTDFFVGTAPEDGQTTQVIQPTNVLQNENFIFFRGKYGVLKHNLKTNEETPVCCDPFCTHWQDYNLTGKPEDACPFNYIYEIHFLYGNKIYYTRSYIVKTSSDGAAEWHDVFSSYDYVTGEYHAIEDIMIPYNTEQSNLTPPHETYQRFGSFCVYGSYAYSFQYRPIHGKGDSAQDYGRVLVRLDLETDQTTDLMPVDDILPEKTSIFTIRNKTIYLLTDNGLWVWKPEEGKVRRVTSIDPLYTRWYRNGECALFDGYLYVMTYHYPNGYADDKLVFNESPVTCLLRIDLKTGVPERLTDVCPDYVFFNDKTIYIVPKKGYEQQTEYWRLNVNPWKESTNPHKKYVRHILKTDMNGENMETVGYCNSDDIASWGLLLTDTGLLGDLGFFEFSTGITYTSSGEIFDDPNNGYIAEPEQSGFVPDIPGSIKLGEETWW